MTKKPVGRAAQQQLFQENLLRYASYRSLVVVGERKTDLSEPLKKQLNEKLALYQPQVEPSLQYLDTLSAEEMRERFEEIAHSNEYFSAIFQREDGSSFLVEAMGVPLRELAELWLQDYQAYRESQPTADPSVARRVAAAHTELVAVHSSMPVYDIGETIARKLFQIQPGDPFPTATIIGGTQGRLELLPFWDAESNTPITPQHILLTQRTDINEFSRLREQAMNMATSYNEEMATYFYSMDAYWLEHARDADAYVELRIEDLMQYTGKKTVKSRGKYTNAYRPDQILRAGIMVYGLGYTMVEIENTIVRGKGTRTHYKRLWEVEDAYVMNTLDGERYLESIRYRPCEIIRHASFGARRETALLMSRVLALDYDKMVTARRLGRYYTWLWRDRAFHGDLDAPVKCETLLARAGIELSKSRQRFARRMLETALDRLELEGILMQWLLVDETGAPVNLERNIGFSRWLTLRIRATPPPAVTAHYNAKLSLSSSVALPAGTPSKAKRRANTDRDRDKTANPLPPIDYQTLVRIRAQRHLSISQMAAQIGIDGSTLSRILSGKTRNPQKFVRDAITKWLE